MSISFPSLSAPSTNPKSLGTKLGDSSDFKAQFSKLKVDNSAGVFRATVAVTLPKNFDGRKAWGKYLRVYQQGNCGSCWAFATATALGSRISIFTGGRVAPKLSAGNLVLCNLGADVEVEAALKWLKDGVAYDYSGETDRVGKSSVETSDTKHVGCDGETLINAWQYLFRFGAVEESCQPYNRVVDIDSSSRTPIDIGEWKDGAELPYCMSTMGLSYDVCGSNSKKAARYYRAGGYYIVPGTESQLKGATERDIRMEIYKFGPVSTGFYIHADFMDWDGTGVYVYDGKSDSLGGHAVVIVGWGEEEQADGSSSIPYWLVLNSWGTDWGTKGYFKIKRGENMCGIEENIVVGFPDLPQIRLYLDWPVYYTENDYTMRNLWRVTETGYKQSLYERMLSGEFKVPSYQMSRYGKLLYPPSVWPNMKTFIAGKTNGSYPLSGGGVYAGMCIMAGIVISVGVGVVIGANKDRIRRTLIDRKK